MGCLYEFIFELVLEVFFEGYIKLMQLCVSKFNLSEKKRKRVNSAIKIFCSLLILSLFCGLVLLLVQSPTAKTIGNYLALIPIVISIIQIVVGLVISFVIK